MPVRGSGPVNPGNLTGRKFAENHKIQEAKRRQAEAERRALAELANGGYRGDEDPAEISQQHHGADVVFDEELGDYVVDYSSKR
jgi:hypothetical protein